MSATLTKPRITGEDLLTMPDDGVERWIVRGELREKPSESARLGLTVRNRVHSETMIQIGHLLKSWLEGQPEPRGKVLGGEVGVRLIDDPETIVGVDVAYISAETAAQQTDDSTIVVGVPILAVEILSPSDTIEGIMEKVKDYQDAGVPLVWTINPYDATVTIYRLDSEPQFASLGQTIVDDQYLPGLRLPVARIFE